MFASGGTIWALALDDGTVRRFHRGDLGALSRDGRHLVIAINAAAGTRLERVATADGKTEEIQYRGDLKLASIP